MNEADPSVPQEDPVVKEMCRVFDKLGLHSWRDKVLRLEQDAFEYEHFASIFETKVQKLEGEVASLKEELAKRPAATKGYRVRAEVKGCFTSYAVPSGKEGWDQIFVRKGTLLTREEAISVLEICRAWADAHQVTGWKFRIVRALEKKK